MHQKVFGVHHRGDGETARQGPVLELYLKLPARHASTIPRLSGTIEVAAVRQESLVIENLIKCAGKPINSPLLVGLEITPFIRKEEGNTLISLRITGSPVRLYAWDLVKNDENFSVSHEPDRPITGGIELNYRPYFCEKSEADMLSGMGLELRVFVPSALYRCEFDLKDIELP